MRRVVTLEKSFTFNGEEHGLYIKYAVFLGIDDCGDDTAIADLYVIHCEDPRGQAIKIDESEIPHLLETSWEELEDEAVDLATEIEQQEDSMFEHRQREHDDFVSNYEDDMC